jgi:hypothetical protein
MGISVVLYQIREDEIKRLVLYLSRDLNTAEKHYWPMELKTKALV